MKCNKCEQYFSNYRALNGHMRTHGPSQGKHTVKRKTKRLSYIKFNCRQCGVAREHQQHSATGKFCSNNCQRLYEWNNITKPKIERGKCIATGNTAVLRYLIERDGYKCQQCGVDKWNNNFLTLDIDHIDGNNKNNIPTNLRFLCPNCHRQTPTWGNNRMSKIPKAYEKALRLLNYNS